jgi:outer membrane receptor protein involved in Fe transport
LFHFKKKQYLLGNTNTTKKTCFMKKKCPLFCILVLGIFTYITTLAQSGNTINGNVKNSSTNEAVSSVSVIIKGTGVGTYTDDKGNFKLTTSRKLPLTLVFSSVGFATKEVEVSSASQTVNITFDPISALGQDVTVSATRTPTIILESPVSVERVNLANIRNTPSPSYYDVIGNLKGVDITTSSFAFKTPSTRGFNGSGNLRFNQLVDGIDNQAPALNFSIGSIVGLTELDVESMDLLPGASSALYGSGGMNGTLLINSKNPFKYQGLSVQIKQGVNHLDKTQHNAAPYYDYSLRYAKKLSEKFAFKISAQYIKVQDWQGTDERDVQRTSVASTIKPGTRQIDPNYDGVNVYGDEASASMNAFAQAVRGQIQASSPQAAAGVSGVDALVAGGATPQQIAAVFGSNPVTAPFLQYLPFLIPTSAAPNNPYKGTFGGQFVSRSGYEERYLVDYGAYNTRFSAGLNYKITNDVEASFLGYYGIGTSVYTGADRYSLKNFKIGQYKLELRSKNWFLRGYTTQESAGDSYTATTAALFINRAWKSDLSWFQQYTGTYGAARLGLVPNTNGAVFPDEQAHAVARAIAETGRLLPGTPEFNAAFSNAKATEIGAGGAKFSDNSSLYHYEGQYNLSDQIKFAEVLVGASFRRYSLNSHGTIFADTTGPIGINEYGGYVQVQKKLLKDVLKLTGSMRYDKNENFDGRFTPRISALIKVAEDNNIRLSYQTGYRFPSTQDQYINLVTGGATRLVGGLPQFEGFFHFDTNPAYTAESIVAYRNSVAAGTPNPSLLRTVKFEKIKPENMQSFEVGYKALFSKKFLLDVYGYYSRYKDFNGRNAVARGHSGDPSKAPVDLASPFTSDNYSFSVNSPTPIKALGYGLGLEYLAGSNYIVSGNFFSDQLKDIPAGFVTFFNAPKYRFNLGFSNPNVFKNIGFNINYRWQDKINWEGTFAAGEVPAYGTLDVMLGYKLPKIKSMIKLGATNVINKYYRSSFGNPEIGGMYYASFGFNVL